MPSCTLSFRRGWETREMSRSSLTHTLPFYLHELLPSLPSSVPPHNPLAHSVLPTSRPSQILAPHIREPGAQDFCTSHTACAQDAPHCRRRSTLLRGISGVFPLFRAPLFPNVVTFPSAIKAVTLEFAVRSPVLLLATIRRCGFFRCRHGI